MIDFIHNILSSRNVLGLDQTLDIAVYAYNFGRPVLFLERYTFIFA